MRHSCFALSLLAALALPAFGQTDLFWNNASGGDWGLAENWSGGVVPNNGQPNAGDRYNVAIDLVGPAYEVTLNSVVEVDDFTLNSPDATLSHQAGRLTTQNSYLDTGTYRLDGGELSGGVWHIADPDSFQVLSNSANRLDRLSVIGDWELGHGALAEVTGGLTLDGTLRMPGEQARLRFAGDQTLAGGTVLFDPATPLLKYFEVLTDGTLEIASDATLRGGRARIVGDGTLVNRGQLVAEQLSYRVSSADFRNFGSLRGTGAEVLIGDEGTSWSNEVGGQIDVTAGQLELRGDWSNQGTLSATDSEVTLGGSYSTASLVGADFSGSSVELGGVLENRDATLDLDTFSGAWRLAGAYIDGGTLHYTVPGQLVFESGESTLSDVTLNAPLHLQGTADLVVRNGLRGSGSIRLDDFSQSVTFRGDQVVDGVRFELEGINANDTELRANGPTHVTLGPDAEIIGTVGRLTGGQFTNQGTMRFRGSSNPFGSVEITPANFVNEGLLEVDDVTMRIGDFDNDDRWENAAGGVIRLSNDATLRAHGNWRNAGLIEVNDSLVDLDGRFSTASLDRIVNNGGEVLVVGELDNTAATWSIASPADQVTLSGALVSGGVIDIAAPEYLTLENTNRFEAATLAKDLDLRSGYLELGSDVTLNDSMQIDRATLRIEGDRTFDNGLATLGRAELAAWNGGSLTFGSGYSVVATASSDIVGDVVNYGQITADSILDIGPLENHGTFVATDDPSSIAGLNNRPGGRVAVQSGADLTLFGEWINDGILEVAGGNLLLAGDYTTAGIGQIDRAGGTVTLSGSLDNRGETLLLDEQTGMWLARGLTILGGVLDVQIPRGLDYDSSSPTVLDGVTVPGDLRVATGSVTLRNSYLVGGEFQIGGVLAFEGFSEIDGETIVLDDGHLVFEEGAALGAELEIFAGGRSDIRAPGVTHAGYTRVEGDNARLEWEDGVRNTGLMEAANEGTLLLLDSWHNDGVLRAAGGTLSLGGEYSHENLGTIDGIDGTVQMYGNFNNVGQTLAVDAGTGPWILGARVQGGTLTARDGVNWVVESPQLHDVTLVGDLPLNRDSSVRIYDGLTLDDMTISMHSEGGNGSKLIFENGQTLAGLGTIVMDGPPGEMRIDARRGPLVIEPGITIRGANGRIRGENTGITLRGLIQADTPGGVIRLEAVPFTNDGTLIATNGATLQIERWRQISNYDHDTGLLVDGNWIVSDGGTMFIENGSITTNDAMIRLVGPAASFPTLAAMTENRGMFELLSGHVFQTSGSFQQSGELITDAFSALAVQGDLLQTSAGRTWIGLAPDASGLLDVAGDANLAGALRLYLQGGYQPRGGDTFTLVTADRILGAFQTIEFSDLPGHLDFTLVYGAQAITLRLIPEPATAGLLLIGAAAFRPRRRAR